MSALASYLDAHAHRGDWLLRVEDIDPPREITGSAQSIIAELQNFGMRPSDAVLYQSTRTDAYIQARDKLLSEGRAFWCGCTRAEIPSSGIYPGTCRQGLPSGKKPRAVRLKVENRPLEFKDRIQGTIHGNLSDEHGDYVIWRADNLPAYQLAVVVDDAWQRIDSVVRGADLLDSTLRQIWLQTSLGLPTPRYAHIPLVIDQAGRKLSKRDADDPLDVQNSVAVLRQALRFLNQADVAAPTPEQLIQHAIKHWDLSRVAKQATQNL